MASAAAVGLAPSAVLVTCIGLSVEYLIVGSMQQQRQSAVHRLEREAATLRHMLEELSGEALSIVSLSYDILIP